MAKIKAEYLNRFTGQGKYAHILFFAIFLTMLTFMLKDIAIFELWAFGDLGIPPGDLEIFYERTFYTWQAEGSGSVRSPVFNINVVMLVASAILGNTVAYKVLLLAAFAISYGSCYYLLKKLNIQPLLCFTAALFYALNPVSIASFIGGEISEIMTFAIFPLMTSILYSLLTGDRYLRSLSILVLLVFLVAWNIYILFWYGVLIALPLLLSILFSKKTNNLNTRKTIGLALVSVLLTLAIFSPTLVIIQEKSPTSSQASFSGDATFTYRKISFQNIIRLAGNTGSAQENLGYNDVSWFAIAGYILSSIAILPIIFLSTKNLNTSQKVFLLSTTVSSVIIILLLLYVKSNPSIVDSDLLFASLRNPRKLLFPLAFALTILLAFGTDRLLSRLRSKLFQRSILIGLVAIIICYNFPVLDGTLGLEKVRGTSYIVDESYSSMPALLQQIDPNYKEYRVFVLPWQHDTNLRIRASLPNYFGTHLGAGDDGINVNEFKNIFTQIGSNSAAIHDIFALHNVKYIIIDKIFDVFPDAVERTIRDNGYAIYYDHNSYWLTGKPEYLQSIFDRDPSFQNIHEDEQFAIYEFRDIAEPRLISAVINTDNNNVIRNPSFEDEILFDVGQSGSARGNWQRWPANLVHITDEDAFNGSRSLKMEGFNNAWSNVHQLVAIEELSTFQLKFSFKAYNMTNSHVKLLWYGQTEDLRETNALRVDFINLYTMNLTEGTWHTIQRTYLPPAGAKMVDIQLLSSKTTLTHPSTLTLYDDVMFANISPSQFLPVTDYQRISPTRYKFTMDIDQPVLISFAQSYDSRWILNIYKDGVLHETVQPIQFYNVINAFEVNTVGDKMEFEIVFPPQSALDASIIFVVVILLLSLGYLVYYEVILRKKENPQYAPQ